MRAIGALLERHRNLFLILLMGAAFIVGMTQGQPDAQDAVSIPVTAVVTPALNSMEAYRRDRDQAYRADMAVLENLASNPDADAAIRDAAAAHLHLLIDAHQVQSDVEGALLNSSLFPCVAVFSRENLTIVTGKSAPTHQDMALILEVARVHAGVPPENVRLITVEEKH